MPIFLLVIQLILFVCWYTVPTMMTLPAWVVFLPLIFMGFGLVVTAVVWIAVAIFWWWAARQ